LGGPEAIIMGWQKLTRRKFLQIAGITTAGCALSACGANAAESISPTGTPSETASPPKTLRELADRAGVELGVGATGWFVEQPRFFDIVRSDFNLVVYDWGIAWNQLEPAQGHVDHSIMSRQLAKLAQSGLEEKVALRGHPVYFPDMNPDWLMEGQYSKTELRKILQDHVRELTAHYKGVIRQWVVVNEPHLVDRPSWRPKDVLYQGLGMDYIEMAFEAAREADPSAMLMFNETDNHRSAGYSTRQTQAIVAKLKTRGLIDGVGCQMHLDGAAPFDAKDTAATMQSYGLPISVTEMDVDMTTVPGEREDRFAWQARIFHDVLAACLRSTVCRSISFWGLVDKYSWLEQLRGRPNADACLLDDDFQPKPAFFALEEVLKEYAG
jgi:endo-1,4-beta-xylanase